MSKKELPQEAMTLRKNMRKAQLVGLTLSIVLVLLVILMCYLGEATSVISVDEIIRIIWGKITFQPDLYADIPEGEVAIVWFARLPRILGAVFVGAGLAVSGGVFQSLLMNPLADPYTIGISSGAAFGASIAIYFSVILGTIAIPVLPTAFAGALITLFLVIAIANRSSGMNASNLIIAGIIVSAIMSAGTSFIKSAAGDDVSAIVFWLMGSMVGITWSDILILIPVIIIGCGISFYFANELNLLCTGEENAKAFGVNVKKVRWMLLISASLMTAACVSVSGIIGFLGLVVPHLLRFGLTSNNNNLLPLSALLGGTLLLLADNVSRLLLASELPVGVITTLLGGPFFLYLFIKKEKKGGSPL
jgi:iron complex transport system permease protein